MSNSNIQGAKLIPANLTTDTFIQRTMAGERFFSPDGLLSYYYLAVAPETATNAPIDHRYHTSPFVVDNGAGVKSMLTQWTELDTLCTQEISTWEDHVSEMTPVLCWVSNNNGHEREKVMPIFEIDLNFIHSYIGSNRCRWMYATPVTPIECYTA